MVSFSITNANSDKAKQSLIRYFKNFIKENHNCQYTFCKFALDNNANAFGFFCNEAYDQIHAKDNNKLVRCELNAFSVDDYGKLIPLASLTGELSNRENLSFVDRLDSFYENKGIGREMMLFWESLVYENTKNTSIDIVAINGEKNISWYERLGYSPVRYFIGSKEFEPTESFPMKEVEGAFMTKDLTLMDFFKNKAAIKSEDIYRSSSKETKIFIKETNKELVDYTVKDKRHVNPETLKDFKNKRK